MSSEFAARNVEHFLPLASEVHRWQDRNMKVELPVFPGYVFVRIEDAPEQRLNVLRVAGTVRILGHGGAIERIPDYEIEGIRRLIASSLPFLSHPLLREGALVRVRRGPLAGVEGRLNRFKSECRLVLSVEILSRSVSTEVYSRDVEVIRPARPARM